MTTASRSRRNLVVEGGGGVASPLWGVVLCLLCLCACCACAAGAACLRARIRALSLQHPVYYKRRGVWCPAAFATDGRRGLLALDVFRRPQFFFLRARGRCQRHRRPSHFHNHYLTVNPSGSAKVRALFIVLLRNRSVQFSSVCIA